jgi:predicted nucleic acid-binding protein
MQEWRNARRLLVAPELMAYELTTAMTKAVRFGQLPPAEARQSLLLAFEKGVQLVGFSTELAEMAFLWTLRLGRAAAYDSFYLALAEQLGCELWTADERLWHAANVSWVHSVTGE